MALAPDVLAVCRAVAAEPCSTLAEVIEVTGLRRLVAEETLSRCMREGWLVATGGGTSRSYTVTESYSRLPPQVTQPASAQAIPVSPGSSVNHEVSARIKVGMETARASGTHVGRAPTPLPEAAIAAVQAGAPVRTVAREYGVSRDTLGRQAARRGGPSSPFQRALLALSDAARLEQRGRDRIAQGEADVREAHKLAREARKLLDNLDPGTTGVDVV